MLNWKIISDHDAYNEERFALLKLLEGSTTKPYVDGVGDATIGIGFNLVYNLDPVLRIMVGDRHWSQTLEDRLATQIDRSYAPDQSAVLIANLNAVMQDWHDHHDSKVPITFAFSGDAAIAKALDALDDYYDGRIDAWIPDIPESSERAALFSLTWNAPSMLGPKLQAAIENGDRAEAWYEIRYNSLSSSLPANLKAAIANRRYVEADTFGLYHSDSRATYAEALDAGRMLADHHQTLLAYEAAYDPLTAASIKGVSTIGSISGELQPAIDAVLQKLHLSVDHPIEELLATAPAVTSLAGDGTAYDSTKNDDDLLLGGRPGESLSGGAGDDVLIGSNGADFLSGGSGADIFVFTSAKDSGVSGKGDTVSDFDRTDRLEFDGGTDFQLLSARNTAFDGEAAEIRWFWRNGATIVEADYNGDGTADLHLTLSGKHALSAGDFIL